MPKSFWKTLAAWCIYSLKSNPSFGSEEKQPHVVKSFSSLIMKSNESCIQM